LIGLGNRASADVRRDKHGRYRDNQLIGSAAAPK
jgi:hypothetical protein